MQFLPTKITLWLDKNGARDVLKKKNRDRKAWRDCIFDDWMTKLY